MLASEEEIKVSNVLTFSESASCFNQFHNNKDQHIPHVPVESPLKATDWCTVLQPIVQPLVTAGVPLSKIIVAVLQMFLCIYGDFISYISQN